MTRVLQPIEHKDAYNAPARNEVIAYFAEAIFAPLFAILERAGVEIDPTFEAIRFDGFGRTNESKWEQYPPSWRSYGLDRDELPQIPGESRGALVNFLAARGIGASKGWALPAELRPTQTGYWLDKLEAAREFSSPDRAILVSCDGYILDGHHQWTAARLDRPAEMVRIVLFDAKIGSLLRLARLLPTSYRENAAGETSLEAALRSGKIQYADGVFSGKFSAATSRELRDLGARFNATTKTFSIAQSKIPLPLRGVLAEAKAKTEGVTKQVLEVLDEAARNISAASVGLNLGRALDAIVADLGTQFVATTASIAPSSIGIVPTIDPALRKVLEADYTRSLDLAVKDFSQEMVVELRALVEENALKFGGRTDRLAKIIESRFGVSKRKADFLADQETGLLVSKYRAARYEAIGITDYIWSTSHDSRVRVSHRELDGKRFSFEKKANVAGKGEPARYCNPGEDWRCRCVPKPLVDIAQIAA